MEELVQSWRFQIPVNGQNPFPVAREDPGDVGERHRAAGAALVGVEGNDLALAGLAHRASPESSDAVILSRGRSMRGPAGGWAVASLRNLFSMVMAISGMSWPKSWRVGIPFAAIWQRRGTLASLFPSCWRSFSWRSSLASCIPRSWLFQGISTLTHDSLIWSRTLSRSRCRSDRLTQASTMHRLGGTGRPLPPH